MKLKFSLIVIMLIGILAFNMACSMMEKNPTANSPCLGITADQSYICSIVPNPQDLSFLLQLANVAAMKKDIYKGAEALKVVDGLIFIFETGDLKYNEIFDIIEFRVDPVLFVVITEYKTQFATIDLPILPYDTGLILKHLKKQRALILMAIEAYSKLYGWPTGWLACDRTRSCSECHGIVMMAETITGTISGRN